MPKKCIVPQCRKTDSNSPSLVFVSVPKNRETRKVWLDRVNNFCRDVSSVCELHFDPLHDIKNYELLKKSLSKNSRKGYTAFVFDSIVPYKNIPGLARNASKYSFVEEERKGTSTKDGEEPDDEPDNEEIMEVDIEEDWDKLCRLCLHKKEETELLDFKHKIEQKTVRELVANVASLRVERKSLPRQVCTTCVIFLLNVQNRLELYKTNEKILLDAINSKNGVEEEDDIVEIVDQTEEIIEVENYTLKSDLEADVEAAIEGHRIDKDSIIVPPPKPKKSTESQKKTVAVIDTVEDPEDSIALRKNKRKQSKPRSSSIVLGLISGLHESSEDGDLPPESFIEENDTESDESGNEEDEVMIGVDEEDIVDSGGEDDDDVQLEYLKRQQEQIKKQITKQPKKRKNEGFDDFDDDEDFVPEPDSDEDWEYGKKKKTNKRKSRKPGKTKN